MKNTEITYGSSDNGNGFSGDYNDLTNKPVIPSTTEDLSDSEDKRYVTDEQKNNIHDPETQDNAIATKVTLAEVKADADVEDAINKKHNEVHNHDTTYEAKNTNIQGHIGSAHAPSNAQKNSDITKAEIEAKLTGEISSHTHSGGGTSDPWIYVKLTSNFTTTGTANVATPLAFTPAASKFYEIEGRLFLQTAVTTTGARPGIAFPTGSVQEAAWVMSPNSATAFVSRFWGAPTTANAAATGVAVANEGIYGKLEAMLVMGTSPSGNFTVTLASEISGSEARIMANSFIRYREI